MSGRTQWCIGISTFAEKTCNPIRALVESLKIQPNPDKSMIALSIGDPTIFGNLRPPEELNSAIKKSLYSGSWDGYAPGSGHLEAKRAVAEYSSICGLQVDPEDIILCSGCSSSLDLCISVLAEQGENILLPRPGFSIYVTLALGLGISVKYYNLKPENDWEVDLDHLESQIDENTACILVNNPSNPCGSVFRREHLQQILKIAERHFLPIIADEIYEHLVFPGSEYCPIASLSTRVPILSCSGLTKRFLVPGWRTGWIVIHDRNNAFRDVRRGLTKLSQRVLGSNTIVQGALPSILKYSCVFTNFFNTTIHTLHKNALLMHSRLSVLPGLHPIMPQGAMYMMVKIDMSMFPDLNSSIHFVEVLVCEESVFCLPGECFQAINFVRLVLTAPTNILEEACDRIELFCFRHCNKKYKVEKGKKSSDLVREQTRCEQTLREP